MSSLTPHLKRTTIARNAIGLAMSQWSRIPGARKLGSPDTLDPQIESVLYAITGHAERDFLRSRERYDQMRQLCKEFQRGPDKFLVKYFPPSDKTKSTISNTFMFDQDGLNLMIKLLSIRDSRWIAVRSKSS